MMLVMLLLCQKSLGMKSLEIPAFCKASINCHAYTQTVLCLIDIVFKTRLGNIHRLTRLSHCKKWRFLIVVRVFKYCTLRRIFFTNEDTDRLNAFPSQTNQWCTALLTKSSTLLDWTVCSFRKLIYKSIHRKYLSPEKCPIHREAQCHPNKFSTQLSVTGITLQNAQSLWRQLLLMTVMNDQVAGVF